MIERLSVPIVFLLIIILFVVRTVFPQPISVAPTPWSIAMSPMSIAPGIAQRIKLTVYNTINKHRITHMAPWQPSCPNVTVVNTTLTYIDRVQACRQADGTYLFPYTFPQTDAYVLFIDMHPIHSIGQAHRIFVPMNTCPRVATTGLCAASPVALNVSPNGAAYTDGTVTTTLEAPTPFVALSPIQVTLQYATADTAPAQATSDMLAISADAQRLVRMRLSKSATNRTTFDGFFDDPTTYKVFASIQHRGYVSRPSFVIIVKSTPVPTSIPTPH